jgi:DNA-binding NtrC family response regulator
VLTLTLPPLRSRGEDVLLLARHYIEVYARKYGRPPRQLADDAIDVLLEHRWVGNVRELAHMIERTMLMMDGDIIEAAQLLFDPRVVADEPVTTRLEEAERQLISQALEECAGNVSQAARRLGVGRELLRYRMRKYQLR